MKKILFVALVMVLMLGLVGCPSAPDPEPEPVPGMGLLEIENQSDYSIDIHLNGVCVDTLVASECVEWEVPVGEHTLEGISGSLSWGPEELTITEAGHIWILQVSY